jgi:predicted PurR-regulated permease PerM
MRERLKQVFQAPGDPDAATTRIGHSAADISLVILATCGLMAVLYWAQEVFIPIVLSVLISYALEPLVRGLTKMWVPRLIASGLVVIAFTGALAYSAYAFSDDVARLVAEIPEAAAQLRQTLRNDEPGAMQQVQEAARELQRTADEAAGPNPAPRGVQRVQIEQPTIDLRAYVSWGSAGAIAFAGQATLIFFFVFFLLASGDLFKRKFVSIAGPSLAAKKVTVQVLDDINRQIERFLIVRAVTSVVVAAGTFIVAFIQFDSMTMAFYVAGISLAITALEGWLLTPWLTSRTARTNEIAVFVGLIFWSFVWGLWGTLLAVPMLVAFKAFCDHVEGLKPVGELLGE